MVIACMQATPTEHVALADVSEGPLGALHLHCPLACTHAIVVACVFVASVIRLACVHASFWIWWPVTSVNCRWPER